MPRIPGYLAALAGLALLAPAQGQDLRKSGPAEERRFATKFGITYRIVPYGRGYGAQLTHDPVPGTAADRVGLKRGDIVIFLNDQPIYSARDVVRHGGQVTVTYVDFLDGRVREAATSLPPLTGRAYSYAAPAPYVLGVSVTSETLRGADVPPGIDDDDPETPPPVSVGGLRIDGFTLNSAARAAGLERGDVILEANGRPMLRLDDLRDAIRVSRGTLKLKVKRAAPSLEVVTPTVRLQPAVADGGPGRPTR
jgi:S1-C subfamily serine protease